MARTITNPEVGAYYNTTGVLEILDCPNCGIQFGAPERLVERARRENRAHMAPIMAFTLYCPLGHSLSWSGLNEEQLVRKQLASERKHAGWLAARASQAEASAKAQRGAATRARNERDRQAKRAKHGVCPCCNRTFKQLARHMQSQHPDFEPGAEGS